MGRKETALLIAIVVNVGLIGLKFLLAGVSGSFALRASAWHSFSDVFVSGIVLGALLLARRDRPASGVSRVEHLVSLVVAAFIFKVGFDIFRDALSHQEQELRNVFWVALAAVLTIAVSYFMARYKTYVGRATGSPALVADGYHSLMDMYSSIVVVMGLFGYAIGFRGLDRVAAVIVVLFIAFAGYEIAHGALAGLFADGHREHPTLAEPQRLLRAAAPYLALGAVALYLLSGVYTVQAGELGLVRRFGRLVATDLPPGLHYRLPWPIEEATRVPVAAVQRAEVPRSLMLTGDQNLVNIAAKVHYRVRSAPQFAFNVDQPAVLVRDAAESALRATVGLRPVDPLLTSDKANVQAEARALLQDRLDVGGAGLEVLSVQLTEASPPGDVASAFLDVASAREDRATYVNEALAYQNEIIPKARGEAVRLVRQAEGYRAEKIANATGEAGRFVSRLAEYRKAPDVTRTRLYLETVEKVLPGVPKFLVSPGVGNGALDLWFGSAAFPPTAAGLGPSAGLRSLAPGGPDPVPGDGRRQERRGDTPGRHRERRAGGGLRSVRVGSPGQHPARSVQAPGADPAGDGGEQRALQGVRLRGGGRPGEAAQFPRRQPAGGVRAHEVRTRADRPPVPG